jgi:Coenzyme PQQ synthesis protein D (PqqD)
MAARRFEINAPAIISEAVDGEVMVMNLRDGIYYSVTGGAAAIWPALVGGVALDEIAANVARTTAAPLARVAADLDVYVARLGDEGILRAATGAAHDPPRIAAVGNYQGFAIERFDDMRAMLILDPVHEVGEFGWPQEGGNKTS